jgi:NAD(P)-dependent dehydrogenase (short-subunit alcohol dehydrogenase family)
MRCSVIALLLLVVAPVALAAEGADSKRSNAVLVTGASTGIGRKITEQLAADGYFVYAGARKEADLKALAAIKNVQAVRLDVTSPQDINAAVETITNAGRGLYGLVNNAGVAAIGSFADTTMEEFDLVMQVNVYGPYRVTKAFMPLLVARKGRIVNIGSLSGILAGRDVSAYSMSKHAVEAFTDSLAGDLAPLGVAVSVIEPGNYKSDIGKNATQRTGAETRFTDRSKYKEPDEVAAATERALFGARPKRRYLVVPEEREAEITIRSRSSSWSS